MRQLGRGRVVRPKMFAAPVVDGCVGHEVRMNPQPLICVRDVEASSRWYQRLLGCQSTHGGPHYERLVVRAGSLNANGVPAFSPRLPATPGYLGAATPPFPQAWKGCSTTASHPASTLSGLANV